MYSMSTWGTEDLGYMLLLVGFWLWVGSGCKVSAQFSWYWVVGLVDSVSELEILQFSSLSILNAEETFFLKEWR